jgi:hypothetical protein
MASSNPQPAEAPEGHPKDPTAHLNGGDDSRIIRTTIDLETHLHRRLKVHAAQKGVRIAELVRVWINTYCP